MQIKKLVITGCLCLAVAIVFSGCGSNKNDGIITGSLPEAAESAIEKSNKESEQAEQAETDTSVAETEEETGIYINTNIDDGYEDGQYYGHLYIDDVGIDVLLYWTDVEGDDNTSQDIVDAEDSAAYFRYGIEYIIADHDFQSFASLTSVVPKTTRARIVLEDGTEKAYVCTSTCNGTKDSHIYDDTGTDLALLNDGGIAIYTCLDDSENVFIAFWQEG